MLYPLSQYPPAETKHSSRFGPGCSQRGGRPLVAQMVKYLPAMSETQVQSLGKEDPLEKGIATHSSTLD